ncbi:hypothetical protein OROMI_000593 [Orobanche minor]
MYSKNTYLLQQAGSRASSSVVNEILLSHHHHHQEMLSGHFLTSDSTPVIEPAVLYNPDIHCLNGDPSASDPPSCPKTGKKDRHSKIYTAQGPRDRRVRLSIGVARKFFDLQEMLGFDKPSKTLDWLLTKSRTAIKHLVSTKQQGSKSTVVSTLSDCEESNYEFSNMKADTKEKSASNNKKNKGVKDSHHQSALNLAKESRVKARARARERTLEKMCIKQQQQQQQQQQININNNGGYEPNPNCSIPIIHCPQGYEDLIQEPIVNKRKVKHPSIFGFQPNYHDIQSTYNVTESWDVSNYASQSSICAILEQHKFNNNRS